MPLLIPHIPLVLAAALYSGPQTSPDHSSLETATLDSSSNRLGQWEQNGVEVDASLILDVSRTSGGLESDDFGRYLADINFALDMESLAGIEGASIGVDLYAQAGRNASDAVGDAQGVSNIDNFNTKIIAEVWWQQWFANDRLRIKVGTVEANSEFASPTTAGEFLNSSMGFSPTISAFPSYPNPAYSISAFVHGEHSYVGLGVFDGATQAGIATGNHGAGSFLGSPSDLFWVLEASTEWDRGLSARAACGLWHHSGTFDTFAGGTDEGTSGFYGILEHGLWVEDAAHAQTVDGFVQVGFSDPDVNAIETHLGMGAVWNGALGMGPNDQIGLGITHVNLSDESGLTEDESTLELYWRTTRGSNLTIKPDLQYVKNPGGDANVDNAFVATLRLEWSF